MTLDELLDEITPDAKGDHELRSAFHQAFQDEVPVPADAAVFGRPVTITKFYFDGNERRHLAENPEITLRFVRLHEVIPGEIAVVKR